MKCYCVVVLDCILAGNVKEMNPVVMYTGWHMLANDRIPEIIWTCHQGISCSSWIYGKTCVKRPLLKEVGFQGDQLSLNTCQKYCRMLQGEQFAILLTFIKLPFVIEIFLLSNFDWLFLLYPQLKPFLIAVQQMLNE